MTPTTSITAMQRGSHCLWWITLGNPLIVHCHNQDNQLNAINWMALLNAGVASVDVGEIISPRSTTNGRNR